MIKRAFIKKFSLRQNAWQCVEIRHFFSNRYEQKKENNKFNLFGIHSLKVKMDQFVLNNFYENKDHLYVYSNSFMQLTLYAFTYTCMTLSIFEKLNGLDEQEKRDWISYLYSFQCQDDRLLYYLVVENGLYSYSDWWGARHIAMHMICVYACLGAKSQYS